jgi:hypothetical protein
MDRLLITLAGRRALALIACGALAFLSVVGCNRKNGKEVKFSVDGRIVHDGDWGHFKGDPQLHIGDPPTPEMKRLWDNTYYQNSMVGVGDDDRVESCWPDSKFHVIYYFRNDKLSRVELHFSSEELPLAVQAVAAKFGPPHYTGQPTFTTRDGTLHQNEIVCWNTDAGRFELSKFLFREDSSWSWQNGIGRLIPPVTPSAEQPATIVESESSGEPETEAQVVKTIKRLGGAVGLATQGDDPAQSVLSVRFSETQFTGVGLEHLKWLPKLRELNLCGTKVTDAALEPIKGLTQLTELNLSNTQITDAGLKHLEGLSQLRKLDLSYTHVRGGGLKHLERLTQLHDLNLSHSSVTDAELQPLKRLIQLTDLDLSSTQITDASIEYLKELGCLRYLYLMSTSVTLEGRNRLLPSLPNILSLRCL